MIWIIYKDSRFIKASENYYSTFYEDLKSLKNLQEKPIDYIKNKYNYYRYSSYYYYYILTKKEIFDLSC